MHSFTIFTAALAAFPLASAGKAYIHNKCDFDVNVWSVDADGSSDAIAIKSGGVYSEDYRKPSQGGVSLKLMNNTKTSFPSGHISQFEYTLANTLWYDMSNVDCKGEACPFAAQGWYLDTSDSSCPTRNCEGGLATCAGAYVNFNDDWNTLMCQADKDINLYLCTATKPSDDDSSDETVEIEQQQVASVQESTPAAAPVAAPAPVAETQTKTKTNNAVYVNANGLLAIGKREHGVPSHRRRIHARHPHSRMMM